MQIINPASSAKTAPLMKTGNKYNFPGLTVTGVNNTSAYTANQWRATKIYLPAQQTLKAAVRVVTATAGALVNAALFSADPATGLPNLRLYDLGQFDMSVVGITQNAGVLVDPGEYWFVYSVNAAISAANVYSATCTPISTIVDLVNGVYASRYDNNPAYANPIASPASTGYSPSTGQFTTPVFLSIS